MKFSVRAKFLYKRLLVLRFQGLSGRTRGGWLWQNFDYGNFLPRDATNHSNLRRKNNTLPFISNCAFHHFGYELKKKPVNGKQRRSAYSLLKSSDCGWSPAALLGNFSLLSEFTFRRSEGQCITLMIVHLLKMYIPQFRYINFIWSSYIFSIYGYFTKSQLTSSQMAR